MSVAVRAAMPAPMHSDRRFQDYAYRKQAAGIC
jgi:hypothetical protein